MTEPTDIREAVRTRYAAAATRSATGEHEQARAIEASYCGTPAPVSTTDQQGQVVFGAASMTPTPPRALPTPRSRPRWAAAYRPRWRICTPARRYSTSAPAPAPTCSSPPAGSAPAGRAIGLDMTEEMLELARRNAAEAGVTNVEFLHGYLEDIPLPDATVDVVISNCVINLATDKLTVLREAARVLRPGGRLAISDVIADPGMDASTQTDMARWTGCIAGALTTAQYEHDLAAAGLIDVAIIETHRVHTRAAAAIIRARKPSAGDSPTTGQAR